MNKTYIIIACIIAVAYIVVEASKIGYKEHLRIENLKIEQKQKLALDYCLKQSEDNARDLWNENCKTVGKKNDCALDIDIANSIENNYGKDRKECLEKYKNKAFVEQSHKTNAF